MHRKRETGREREVKEIVSHLSSQNLLPGDQNICSGIELGFFFVGQLLPRMYAYCVFVCVKFH